ncbi:hypothetical protein [Phyllobacterium bourgognense]|uniref:hypothetical protein n=1 Tax=Phyllobacterium bourgognense TaxID=314236 RepID=UPI0011C07B1B|nr:hypothetical protein [Phyllobacterium bourgognense]
MKHCALPIYHHVVTHRADYEIDLSVAVTPLPRRGAYSGLVARIAGDAIGADQFLPVCPEAWEARHGRVLQPGQSRVKDRSRFDRVNADRWSSRPSSPSNIQLSSNASPCSAAGDRPVLRAGRRTTALCGR